MYNVLVTDFSWYWSLLGRREMQQNLLGPTCLAGRSWRGLKCPSASLGLSTLQSQNHVLLWCWLRRAWAKSWCGLVYSAFQAPQLQAGSAAQIKHLTTEICLFFFFPPSWGSRELAKCLVQEVQWYKTTCAVKFYEVTKFCRLAEAIAHAGGHCGACLDMEGSRGGGCSCCRPVGHQNPPEGPQPGPGTIPMLGTTRGMQQCWLQLLHQPLLPPWATFYSFLGCKMGS